MGGDQSAPAKLAGVVLCGGQSRRMGTSKAWLQFGDETLLERTVRLVASAADPVVVVAAVGQDLPELAEGVRVVRDPVPALGPLQGIAVGLAAVASAAQFAYVAPTDAPFISKAFIRRMAALVADHDLAMLEEDGYLQPLHAVYRTALHKQAEALLAANKRRPVGLVDVARARIVRRSDLLADPMLQREDPALEALTNLNTPEAYRAALARLDQLTGLPPKS